MTIDYNWLEDKLMCGVHQSATRGLLWNKLIYGIRLSNGYWVLSERAPTMGIYPMSIFIVGQKTLFRDEMYDMAAAVQLECRLISCVTKGIFADIGTTYSQAFPLSTHNKEHQVVFEIARRVGNAARSKALI